MAVCHLLLVGVFFLVAKELPYFQFEPAQYLTGNIQFCSLEAQGLFSNICSIYWQRECELTKDQLYRKFSQHELINELIQEKVIKLDGQKIIISFLFTQYITISGIKQKLSDAGKKGADKKNKATLKPPLSHPKKNQKGGSSIREEKIIEDKINVRPLVLLTADQIEKARLKLIGCYEWGLDELENHKQKTGKKYKSDYHALIGWVYEKAVDKGKIIQSREKSFEERQREKAIRDGIPVK